MKTIFDNRYCNYKDYNNVKPLLDTIETVINEIMDDNVIMLPSSEFESKDFIYNGIFAKKHIEVGNFVCGVVEKYNIPFALRKPKSYQRSDLIFVYNNIVVECEVKFGIWHDTIINLCYADLDGKKPPYKSIYTNPIRSGNNDEPEASFIHSFGTIFKRLWKDSNGYEILNRGQD